MPRGRHRHSPPLHRLLPPSAIAGVSVACALGPWVFSEATVLRVLAAAAAATSVVGAFVMRRWDTQAGKQVAELTRARAGDEWRYEERVAELETDLEESRELRAKLEQRLRAKRAELAGLRNEHAALLRRYATAETERASALEGRRLLELEAAAPEPGPASSAPRALPPARSAGPRTDEAPETADAPDAEAPDAEAPEDAAGAAGPDARADMPAVFSAEGARLYGRALMALARFGRGTADGRGGGDEREPRNGREPGDERADDGERGAGAEGVAETVTASGAGGDGETPAGAEVPAVRSGTAVRSESTARSETAVTGEPVETAVTGEPVETAVTGEPVESAVTGEPEDSAGSAEDAKTVESAAAKTAESVVGTPEAAGDEAAGAGSVAKGEGVEGGVTDGAGALPAAESAQEAGQASAAGPARPAGPPPAGHFAVPTAVAVVPPAPARRPVVEGGFDFFGTQKGARKETVDSVQNEDLADVVGPEALAVHKAETEAGFKPADARSREVGQVIDLTAHDETEQIDVQGLRTAAS